jgi:hypothetical protein
MRRTRPPAWVPSARAQGPRSAHPGDRRLGERQDRGGQRQEEDHHQHGDVDGRHRLGGSAPGVTAGRGVVHRSGPTPSSSALALPHGRRLVGLGVVPAGRCRPRAPPAGPARPSTVPAWPGAWSAATSGHSTTSPTSSASVGSPSTGSSTRRSVRRRRRGARLERRDLDRVDEGERRLGPAGRPRPRAPRRAATRAPSSTARSGSTSTVGDTDPRRRRSRRAMEVRRRRRRRRIRRSGSARSLRRRERGVVTFVGVDDVLDDPVPHHVLAGQPDERHAVDTTEDPSSRAGRSARRARRPGWRHR